MTEPFLEAEYKSKRVGLRRNMEDADLSSDTLSWRNLQNIQMLKFKRVSGATSGFVLNPERVFSKHF